MKKQYLNCISICIVIIISGVTCENEKNICKHDNDECYKNEDCCSQNCKLNLTLLKGNCSSIQNIPVPTNNTNSSKSINDIDGKDYKLSKCAYYKENNESLKNNLFKRFKINAAHSILLPSTQIVVYVNNIFTKVNINDNPPTNKSDMTLYLSEEAAKHLNIVREGIFPCEIMVLEFGSYKLFMYHYSYFLPLIGVILILWQIRKAVL